MRIINTYYVYGEYHAREFLYGSCPEKNLQTSQETAFYVYKINGIQKCKTSKLLLKLFYSLASEKKRLATQI